MSLRTTTAPQPPDANETLSDLVWRNRRNRIGNPNLPARQPAPSTEPVITRRHFHLSKPLWGILASMLIALALWVAIQQAVIPAWNNLQDQWHYGDNRITQMNANVGHGGTSHFIAEYYHQEMVIVEISLANPNNHHVYTLAGMIGATDTPVILLSVWDVNHNGKPDLIVQAKGTTFETILYNTGTAFSESEG